VVKLEDILDVNNLNEMRRDGYIRQAKHPSLPLVSECYTKQTMFEKKWNNETRICRGLIWNTETLEVVARPFAKFFNWGEPSCPHIEPDEWVKVWNKLDGSLGIIYNTPDGPAVATKNSFTSPQAVHATEVLRTRYSHYRTVDMFTTLVEIVYPENRIVLDYGETDDLFYLCDVRKDDGFTSTFGNASVFQQPKLLGTGRFLEMADHFIDLHRANSEGVVIHAVNSDIRVKMKQKDYLELHKVCTGLNKKALWTMLSEGQGISEILSDLPEELHDWAFPILQDICHKYTELDLYVAEQWMLIEHMGLNTDRKKLSEVMSQFPSWLSYALWFQFDGDYDRYNRFLWKQVKPSG